MGAATRIGLLTVVLAWPHESQALDPQQPLASYNLRIWGVEKGLPPSTVRAIAQTPDGYLWVGTDAGLARFDGVRFVAFDASDAVSRSEEIRTLLVDRAGILWIGRYRGRGLVQRLPDGAFASYQDGAYVQISAFSSLEDRRGRLWFGGSHTLARKEGETIKRFSPSRGLPAGDVNALAESSDGALWVATSHELARFRDEGFERIPLPTGDAKLQAVVADGPDAVWVGTEAGLVRREAGRTRLLTTADGLPHNAVQALAAGRDGTLWIGTAAGLARSRQGRIEKLSRRDGLPDDTVQALFEDREGNLWIGTRNAVLLQLTDAAFTQLGAAQGLSSERALSLRETRDGSFWIGTVADGLMRLRGGRVDTFHAADGLCTEGVSTLAEDTDSGLWIGGHVSSGGSLCRFKDNRFRSYPTADGQPLGPVRVLHVDHAGVVWIGSDGLFRFEGGRVVPEPPSAGAFKNVTSLHEDRARRLWASSDAGIFVRTEGVWSKVAQKDGPPSLPVYAFHEDDEGNLWMGSAQGLGRFRDGSFAWFGRRQGLPESRIFAVVGDGLGFLWMTSPRGIFRVATRDLALDRIAVPTTFGITDGLRSSRCEGGLGGPAAWKDRTGRLWFPTSGGLASVDPAALPPPPRPPPVVVERLIVDGSALTIPGEPRAPPGRGAVQIEYTALALRAPEKVRFRYRLDPFDPDWVEAAHARTANYTNLAPGRYTFRVMAGVEPGAWNEARAALAFSLAPHLHQTPWFRGLAVAALALMIAGLYRLRMRRMQSQHAAVLAERTRIAREMHDTLAQGFTGISLQLEAATRRLPAAPAEAQENLDKARILVRMSLGEARRAVWDLRTSALDAQDLPSALDSLVRQFAAGECTVTVAVSGHARKLSDEHERTILRLAQEAVTNAMKHARPKRVEVRLGYQADFVELVIDDDGSGFDATTARAPAGHFGLLGMEERVTNLGGSLLIRSQPGLGTTVTARLPIRS